MAIYGYARVSTPKQMTDGSSLEAQRNMLMENGVGADNLFVDIYTGTKIDRPEFSKLKGLLKAGDTLVVTKLDRFARTAAEGSMLVKELVGRGVKVHILNMGLAENSSMGNLMITIMLAFAEYERDMIVERTMVGKAVARENGIRVDGRPKKFPMAQLNHAMSLLDEGNSFNEVVKMTGISRSTLLRERRERKKKAM